MWLYQRKLHKYLSNIPLDSDQGKILFTLLEERGRKSFKRRGRLWTKTKKEKQTIADLLFTDLGTIPFYLFNILSYVIEKEYNDEVLLNIKEKMQGVARCLCNRNKEIIVITYKKLLKQFYNIHTVKEDLYIEGYIGLMCAVYGFSPYKKVKFDTYAFNWCKKYMHAYITHIFLKDARNVLWDDRYGKIFSGCLKTTS